MLGIPALSVRPKPVVVEKLNTKQWIEFPAEGELGVQLQDVELLYAQFAHVFPVTFIAPPPPLDAVVAKVKFPEVTGAEITA